jgi:hypothetical protein
MNTNTFFLLPGATPTKLDERFSDLIFLSKGVLFSFNYDHEVYGTNRYVYHSRSEFKRQHQVKKKLFGYFIEEAYIAYWNEGYFLGKMVTYDSLIRDYKIDFSTMLANVGDTVTVPKVLYIRPNSIFFRRGNYNFPLEPKLSNDNQPTDHVMDYLDYSDEDFREIIIPENAEKSITIHHNEGTPVNYLYNANFAYIVLYELMESTFSAEEEARLCSYMTNICFRIRHIVDNIFPFLLSSESWSIVDSKANDITGGYVTELGTLQQLLFDIKKQWYYYYLNPNDSTEENNSQYNRYPPDFLFDHTGDIRQYHNYYLSLISFYDSTYKIRYTLLEKPEDKRLKYLIDLLPSEALASASFDARISLLKDLIIEVDQLKHESIKRIIENTADDVRSQKKTALAPYTQKEAVELRILKIINSTRENEVDELFDFLLQADDEVRTNFEVIYYALDDETLGRLPLLGGFLTGWVVGEASNRMAFVYTLFKMWKISKFNNYYYPEFNAELADPNLNSFFNENCDIYNDDNVYSFQVDQNNQFIKEYSFESTLKGKQCSIDLVNYTVDTVSVAIPDGASKIYEDREVRTSNKRFFGVFHIFQDIKLVGYKPDSELVAPESNIGPVFLYHYIKEFEEIKKFDAAVEFMVELGLEILFFMISGGLSSIKQLRHLGQLSKVKKLLNLTASSEQVFLTLTGLQASGNLVMHTSSVFYSFFHWATIENPEDPRNKKLANLFFNILLLQLGVNLLVASRIRRIANELEAMGVIGLEESMASLINDINLSRIEQSELFRSKLSNLPVSSSNGTRIIDLYEEATYTIQNAFRSDLEHVLDKKVWIKLNEHPEVVMGNFKKLYEVKSIDRCVPNLLMNTERVDALVRFNQHLPFQVEISKWSYLERVGLVDRLGGMPHLLFDELKLNIGKLREFRRYSAAGKTLAQKNPGFWLKCNFSPSQLEMIQPNIRQALDKVQLRNLEYLFMDGASMDLAIEKFIGNGRRWSSGNLVEVVHLDDIIRSLRPNQAIVHNLDIRFIDSSGNFVNLGERTTKMGQGLIEIDAVIINTDNSVIENVLSIKSSSPADRVKDIDRLMFMKQISKPGSDFNAIMGETNIFDSKMKNKILNTQASGVKFVHMLEVKGKVKMFDLNESFGSMIKDQYLHNDYIVKDFNNLPMGKDNYIHSIFYSIQQQLK